MRIHLRLLRESEAIQQALQRDGWKLQWEGEDSLTARHPLVHDETTGRSRLQDLGLLTTSSARIEFVKLRNRSQITAS